MWNKQNLATTTINATAAAAAAAAALVVAVLVRCSVMGQDIAGRSIIHATKHAQELPVKVEVKVVQPNEGKVVAEVPACSVQVLCRHTAAVLVCGCQRAASAHACHVRNLHVARPALHVLAVPRMQWLWRHDVVVMRDDAGQRLSHHCHVHGRCCSERVCVSECESESECECECE